MVRLTSSSIPCPGPYNMIEGVGGFRMDFENEKE